MEEIDNKQVQNQTDPDSGKPTKICCELEKFIKELHEEYEIWYAKSVRRNYRWWWGLQIASLLVGFVFVIIAALSTAEVFGVERKRYVVIVLIVLPALSSLLATIIIQFRIYDTWRLREEGRIAFQNLVVEGRRRYSQDPSIDDCKLLFADLQKRANEIEASQSEGFFSFTKPNFVASFSNANEDR